jgi:catalase (peroxidase I)
MESNLTLFLSVTKLLCLSLLSFEIFYLLLLTVAAIRSMGGPTIPWSSGRLDAIDPSAVTPDGRLPNADSGPPGSDKSDAAHLRTIFYRMGFNDQEIVALSGAHALGRCHSYVKTTLIRFVHEYPFLLFSLFFVWT